MTTTISPGPIMARVHTLKTRTLPFWAVWAGHKRHEIRVNDRGFEVGDLLDLREFEPGDAADAPRFRIIARVTYITHGGEWGLPKELCVLSIEIRRKFDAAGVERPRDCTCEREIRKCPEHDQRGVHFPCEKCGAMKGSCLSDGWYRCLGCGYPSK